MKSSRRELALLLPAFAAAQNRDGVGPMPSAALRYESIPARNNGPITVRQMLKGATHAGVPVDLHETELPPGQAPHAPHRHIHEEILLIREGALDVTIAGATTRLGPGSTAYFASNQLHGWNNPGAAPARYFVLALGDDRG